MRRTLVGNEVREEMGEPHQNSLIGYCKDWRVTQFLFYYDHCGYSVDNKL